MEGPMPYYRVVGEVPRKRHTQFRRPDGGLYAEELMGEEGFSSDSSLLYHRHLPTAIIKAEAVTPAVEPRLEPNLPLSPRHFRTQELTSAGDLVTGRMTLAGNGDVRLSYATSDRPSELYRNSMGDECVYVPARAGALRVHVRRDRGRRGRLRGDPDRHHPPLGPAGRPGERAGHRGGRAHQAAEALPVAVRPVPGARALLRARPARPVGAARRRRRGGPGPGTHARRG
ncbi:hypothetical protein GCM10020220_014140 [Nonomuraea rubra]